MGWMSKVFSSFGVDIARTVGNVLDELTTTDEEIELTKVQQEKVKAAFSTRMQELLNQLDKQQAEHEENLENELTERLKIDMKSDSFLSKNIRPAAMAFLTAVVSIMAFATVFNGSLSQNQLTALKEWIPFFSTIMLTVYTFYFGSRGIEKIQKIRMTGAAEREKIKRRNVSSDLEPKG